MQINPDPIATCPSDAVQRRQQARDQAVLAAYVRYCERHGRSAEILAAAEAVYPRRVDAAHIIAALDAAANASAPATTESLIRAAREAKERARETLPSRAATQARKTQPGESCAVGDASTLSRHDDPHGLRLARMLSEMLGSGDSDVIYALSQLTLDVKSEAYYGQLDRTYDAWRNGTLAGDPKTEDEAHE